MSSPPPPIQSPTPPANPDDATDSGVRQVTERQARQLAEAHLMAFVEKQRRAEDAEAKAKDAEGKAKEAEGRARRARVMVAALVATAMGTALAVVSVSAFAQQKIDGGVAPVKKTLEQHLEDDRRDKNAIAQQTRELQLDVRELYKASRYDTKSDRLEAPPPPAPVFAGPSDGGVP